VHTTYYVNFIKPRYQVWALDNKMMSFTRIEQAALPPLLRDNCHFRHLRVYLKRATGQFDFDFNLLGVRFLEQSRPKVVRILGLEESQPPMHRW
jgi:hypothetical protein